MGKNLLNDYILLYKLYWPINLNASARGPLNSGLSMVNRKNHVAVVVIPNCLTFNVPNSYSTCTVARLVPNKRAK